VCGTGVAIAEAEPSLDELGIAELVVKDVKR
jgi:hypothetical protein